MARIVIPDLNDEVIASLETRARRHGRSFEAEICEMLREAAAEERRNYGLGTEIANRFRGCGLEEGDIQELRGFPIEPATFDDDA